MLIELCVQCHAVKLKSVNIYIVDSICKIYVQIVYVWALVYCDKVFLT